MQSELRSVELIKYVCMSRASLIICCLTKLQEHFLPEKWFNCHTRTENLLDVNIRMVDCRRPRPGFLKCYVCQALNEKLELRVREKLIQSVQVYLNEEKCGKLEWLLDS